MRRSSQVAGGQPIPAPASSTLRIPAAGFVLLTQETHLRGGATDREPSQLLTARAEIERKLEGTAADPHWLQLEARADLLEEKYDPAIDILDRLLAAGPATPELLTARLGLFSARNSNRQRKRPSHRAR